MKFHITPCICCPSYLTYTEAVPTARNGVMMHMGDKFCSFKKKPRRIKTRELKRKVPDWCPKRRSPALVSIYGFKDQHSRQMHELYRSMSEHHFPSTYHYERRYKGTMSMTVEDFWRSYENGNPISELVGEPFGKYEVLELDDGLVHEFFYDNGSGLDRVFFHPPEEK